MNKKQCSLLLNGNFHQICGANSGVLQHRFHVGLLARNKMTFSESTPCSFTLYLTQYNFCLVDNQTFETL